MCSVHWRYMTWISFVVELFIEFNWSTSNWISIAFMRENFDEFLTFDWLLFHQIFEWNVVIQLKAIEVENSNVILWAIKWPNNRTFFFEETTLENVWKSGSRNHFTACYWYEIWSMHNFRPWTKYAEIYKCFDALVTWHTIEVMLFHFKVFSFSFFIYWIEINENVVIPPFLYCYFDAIVFLVYTKLNDPRLH